MPTKNDPLKSRNLQQSGIKLGNFDPPGEASVNVNRDSNLLFPLATFLLKPQNEGHNQTPLLGIEHGGKHFDMSESRMIPQEEQAQVLSPRARWHPIGQHFQHCNTVQNLPDTAATLRTRLEPFGTFQDPNRNSSKPEKVLTLKVSNTSELSRTLQNLPVFKILNPLFCLSELPERQNHPNSAKCSWGNSCNLA